MLHIIMWSFLFLFLQYVHTWLVSDLKIRFMFSAINIATIILSYYFLAFTGLPYFYGGQWLKLLFSLVFIYAFNTAANYYSFHLMTSHYNVMAQMANRFGHHGLWGALTGWSTLLINWSFSLSTLMIPLVLKIIKDLLMVRTKSAELERDNLKLELKFLQTQIQPHFVLNSINSVYSMVAGTNDDAGQLLLRLADLLRYALHDSARATVSLSQEVDFLRGYISVEAVRQHERTTLVFHYNGPFDRFQISPLLLVTFVENAFKHGINATYRQAWADFRLNVDDEGNLRFQVENSRPPADIQGKQKNKSSGLGLENTRRRLELLYPNQHKLTIHENADTFMIELMLKLKPVEALANYSGKPNSTPSISGTANIYLPDRR